MNRKLSHLYRCSALGLALAAGLCTALPSLSYAKETIRLSIVFSPGGSLDSAARVLVREAEKELNAEIIPQNVTSGGGMAGVAKLAGAPKDGSQLAACVSNALIFIPHRQQAPYKPLKDVEPLLIFGQASPVLVTRPDAEWKDLDAFLDATRQSKGELRIGVPGLGTPSHIALAMMAAKDPALKWRFVPFAGPGEAEAALLGGHVDAAASGALPRIRGGQLHPLMVLAGAAIPALPGIPSLMEAGFNDPGRGDSSFVLLAPAGVPEEKLEKLCVAFGKAAKSEAYLKAMEGWSVAPAFKDRIQSKAFLREVWQEESAILKAVGIADKPATAPE